MLSNLQQVVLLKNKFIELSENLNSNSVDNFINLNIIKIATKELCLNSMEQLRTAKNFVASLKINDGCFCGNCFDLSIFDNKIPFELEILLNCSQIELSDKVIINGKI